MSETQSLTDRDFELAAQPEIENQLDLNREDLIDPTLWDHDGIRDEALRLATVGRNVNEYTKTPNASLSPEIMISRISVMAKNVVNERHHVMEKDSFALAA